MVKFLQIECGLGYRPPARIAGFATNANFASAISVAMHRVAARAAK